MRSRDFRSKVCIFLLISQMRYFLDIRTPWSSDLKPLSSDFVEENLVFFCYFNLTPNIVTSQVKPDRIFFNFSSLDAQIHLSIEKNLMKYFPEIPSAKNIKLGRALSRGQESHESFVILKDDPVLSHSFIITLFEFNLR